MWDYLTLLTLCLLTLRNNLTFCASSFKQNSKKTYILSSKNPLLEMTGLRVSL